MGRMRGFVSVMALALGLSTCSTVSASSDAFENLEASMSNVTDLLFGDAEGIVEGQVYKNERFGFQISFADGWTLEKTAENEQAIRDYVDDKVDDTVSLYCSDLYATSPDITSNVNVQLEFDSDFLSMDESDIEGLMESEINGLRELLIEVYQSDDVEIQINSIMFDDRMIPCMDITTNVWGMTLYQKEVIFLDKAFMATISFSSLDTDTMNQLVANLKPYDDSITQTAEDESDLTLD